MSQPFAETLECMPALPASTVSIEKYSSNREYEAQPVCELDDMNAHSRLELLSLLYLEY
jgi:hypothetical protein